MPVRKRKIIKKFNNEKDLVEVLFNLVYIYCDGNKKTDSGKQERNREEKSRLL